MSRLILLFMLCLTLACTGIAGVHAHLERLGMHDHAAGAEHVEARILSLADADHFSDHEKNGDIDADILIKAFGQLSLAAMLCAVGTFLVLIGLVDRALSVLLPRNRTQRLPDIPPRFHLLPPSHAPPRTAFSR